MRFVNDAFDSGMRVGILSKLGACGRIKRYQWGRCRAYLPSSMIRLGL